MARWHAIPKADVEIIVKAARNLVATHERRSITSERSTLGEEDALFNLWYVIDQRIIKADER